MSREHGLVFNSKKCTIKAPHITFFGTLYDKDGAHPDPKKVEDIHKIPTPTNATELQEFLGIVTYMGPFIPNLSQSTASLRDLLKKDIDFQWSDAHQNVFEKVKAAICAETTLAYFDRDKDTVIQVDASGRGLGAVLLQEGRPIAYASKSLTDTEKMIREYREGVARCRVWSRTLPNIRIRQTVCDRKRPQTPGDDPVKKPDSSSS